MTYLASTYTFGTGGRGAFSGQLQWINADYSDFTRIHLPPSVAAIERHPSVVDYQGRKYMVGGHTRNILVDEDLRCVRQGMAPPPPPSLAVGGGAIAMIGYLRWYDEITGERSSISDGTSVVGAVPRTWSSLPTLPFEEEITIEGTVTVAAGVVTGVTSNFGSLRPGDRIADATVLTRWAQVRSIASDTSMTIDDTAMAIGAGGTIVVKPVFRPSHVEGWVAVSGALPRLAMRARIGTASVVESVATLALGEALADTYEPMPTGGFSVLYNDRQVLAGVEGSRDTVFLSDIGFPERHGGLRFRTDFGEPIVGLFCHNRSVIVLCATPDGESSYRLHGYTDDDFRMDPLEAKAGGMGHHGNREIAGGYVVVPSLHGPQIFDGAFHPAMPTRKSEWMRDCRSNIAAFEGGFAAVNPNDDTYRFAPYVHRIDIGSSSVEEPLAAQGLYMPLGTSCQVYRDGGGGGLSTYANIFPAGVAVGQSGIAPVTGTPRGLFGGQVGGGVPGAYKIVGDLPMAPADLAFSIPAGGAPSSPQITAILEIDAVTWWIGCGGGGGGGDARVYSWDGSGTPAVSDAPAHGTIVKLFTHGTDIIALYSRTAAHEGRFRRRTGGAWGNIALPAPYVIAPAVPGDGALNPRCAATLGGNLYIGCDAYTIDGAFVPHYKAVILKWDGANLTVVNETTIASLGLGGSDTLNKLSVNTMVVFDSKLYYGFMDRVGVASGLNTGIVGRTTDGAAFTDVFKNLDTQFFASTGIHYLGINRLLVYNSKLRAFMHSKTTGLEEGIFTSPGTDVAGVWTRPVTARCGSQGITSSIDGGAVILTSI